MNMLFPPSWHGNRYTEQEERKMEGAAELAEFVSDALELDPRPTAREIAEMYVDRFASVYHDFEAEVNRLIPTIEYLLP